VCVHVVMSLLCEDTRASLPPPSSRSRGAHTTVGQPVTCQLSVAWHTNLFPQVPEASCLLACNRISLSPTHTKNEIQVQPISDTTLTQKSPTDHVQSLLNLFHIMKSCFLKLIFLLHSHMTTQLHLAPRLRMRGTIPPLPQHVFVAWCIVKHRDNFTFTFVCRGLPVVLLQKPALPE
jgi:hypothetical protein